MNDDEDTKKKPSTTQEEKRPKLGRREFLAASGAAAGMAALGRAMPAHAAMDLDGRQGIDLPGERMAAVGADGPTAMRIPHGWRGLNMVFYEMSGNDPDFLEIYAYCDELSYGVGDTVKLHITTTAPAFDIEIYRDGLEPETVYKKSGIKGKFTRTPLDCYEKGCNWPVLDEFKVPSKWRFGFYIILLTIEKNGEKKRSEAGFVLRGNKKAKIAYLLTTCTWQAYNSWGGANHY